MTTGGQDVAGVVVARGRDDVRPESHDAQAGPDGRLVDALADLNGTVAEAREEGFEPLSEVAIGNARRLLESLFELLPKRCEVYPTPDAEVAIDIPGKPGSSVIVLCASDGAVLCLVNLAGDWRRARYSSASRTGFPTASSGRRWRILRE